MEQRIQSLALALPPPENSADTFAERAENYYQKRPQLISLIQDLHNRYLYLSDRYSQTLLKLNTHSHHQQSHTELSDDDLDDRPPLSSISTFSDADAESTLSFFHCPSTNSLDPVLVELTMSLVEKHLLLDEMWCSERKRTEFSKKVELQRSLVEVMESERVVLVAENARLELEAGYLRRKAGELAKCVAMMRDDHRVCLLGRRIEGLQKMLRGMERREREWRDVVGRRERGVREEMERMREENRRLRLRMENRGSWWGCVGGGAQRRKNGGGEKKKKKNEVGDQQGCLWVNPCFCI